MIKIHKSWCSSCQWRHCERQAADRRPQMAAWFLVPRPVSYPQARQMGPREVSSVLFFPEGEETEKGMQKKRRERINKMGKGPEDRDWKPFLPISSSVSVSLGGGGLRGSHLPFFPTMTQSVSTKDDMNIPKPKSSRSQFLSLEIARIGLYYSATYSQPSPRKERSGVQSDSGGRDGTMCS